jgi:hypothetical protein
MTAVFRRLENVREAMKQLVRDLNAPNLYFDRTKVDLKVSERLEQIGRASGGTRAL